MNELIKAIVEEYGPIRGVDLASRVCEATNCSFLAFDAAIQQLLSSGEIVEVEYSLPSMSYRLKSLFFPKGCTIQVKSHVEQ